MFKVLTAAFLAAIASAISIGSTSTSWDKVNIDGLNNGVSDDGTVLVELYVAEEE